MHALNTSLDVQGLVDCLSHVPPVALQAVELLRSLSANPTGGWFPKVPPECVAEATQQLIVYTQSCSALLDKLKYLPPVTLSTVEITTWPL